MSGESNTPLPDCGNRYGVGWGADRVHVPRDIPPTLPPDEALVLAAWLVAVTGEYDRFAAIMAEVQSL